MLIYISFCIVCDLLNNSLCRFQGIVLSWGNLRICMLEVIFLSITLEAMEVCILDAIISPISSVFTHIRLHRKRFLMKTSFCLFCSVLVMKNGFAMVKYFSVRFQSEEYFICCNLNYDPCIPYCCFLKQKYNCLKVCH